jgi:hypothetical protein
VKVQDLTAGVTRKLGNRTDITNDVPLWIRDAILEITESYDFSELQTTGPLVQFTIGQCRYPVSFFTNNNERATRIGSWFRFNTGTPTDIQDTSLNGMMLKFRTKPVVEQMAKSKAPPSKYSRINDTTLIVGPSPDQGYYSFQNYQKEHPFPEDTTENNNFLATLLDSDLYIPKSWKLIIEFWAARLGALEKRMLDVAQNYHEVLFGDPNFQKTSDLSKGTPGLIFHRVSQFERDASQNERALQPVVINSCSH